MNGQWGGQEHDSPGPSRLGTNCPYKARSEPGSSELYVGKRREMKRVI